MEYTNDSYSTIKLTNGSNTIKLIDLLFKQHLLTNKELEEIHDEQSSLIGSQKSLQDLLVEMGYIKEEDLTKILSKAYLERSDT